MHYCLSESRLIPTTMLSTPVSLALHYQIYIIITLEKSLSTVVITNALLCFSFRSLDPHIKDGYLFNISLRHEHNHRLFCADALQKRDVSRETIDKLKILFESGHSPSSALDTIKYDLQEQEGDNYIYAAADRSICPDLQFCFRFEAC